MKCFIGTSGWQYYHWRGKFYPDDLNPKDFLKFYSKNFNTVEINASFYRFIKRETFEKWRNMVGDEFSFSVKLHKLFTHLRRLMLKREDIKILKKTLQDINGLGKCLGSILIQLPPSLKKNTQLLETFLKHIEGCYPKGRPKVAIEFRHPSWLDSFVYQFLKRKKIIFVISDSPKWKTAWLKTSDVIYVRFHGRPKLFASRYETTDLQEFSQTLKELKPRFLYAYFNNDFNAHAIENAIEFRSLFFKTSLLAK